MEKYYTYAYLHEDKTPYYIGKGKSNRAYKKHQKGINVPKDETKILILKQNLTEEEAFKHEKYMIAVFGRKDLGNGILYNKNAGGNGSSGKIYSQIERSRIRQNVLGKKWWNNGIENSHSKECPGDGWVLGRIITWNENKRLENMKATFSKYVYKFIHISGEIVYCQDLNNLQKILNTHHFKKLLYKRKKSYKGWISVEKYFGKENIIFNPKRIIELTNSYKNKIYKITHISGKVMYFSGSLTSLGKQYGSKEGFLRLLNKTRKSYKGWILIEVL